MMQPTNIVHQLPRHATKRYPRRTLSDITHVMFHHSATIHGTQGAEDFARWHINGNGWPGIAYAFVIDPDGKTYQTTELNELGYHCKGRNRVAIGVCIVGNFDEHPPTLEQLESAKKLAVQLNQIIGRRLLIDWHDEHRPTSCPGKLFPKAKLSKAISDHYNPTPNPAPDNDPEDEPEPPYYAPEIKVEPIGCAESGGVMALMFAIIVIAFFLYLQSPIS